ncbi:MAG: hydroxymethylglutaryl-CoA lyase [Firmicutes bacterium]|nr:hydroxymethylglutaryl-CoA lyase [Bacillota bacterium]
MQWPERVLIREVGPRDGLQSEAEFVPTERKVEYVRALAQAGVTAIEATSFMHPKAVPQMSDAEGVMAGLNDISAQIVISALVGNVTGMKRAVAAGVKEVVIVVSASEAHNRANLGKSVGESLAGLEEICFIASGAGVRLRGAVATAFGCPYEGDVGPGRVGAVVNGMKKAGIREVTLADTAGLGNPGQVHELITILAAGHPEVVWALHFHDTRGLALANIVMGLQAGVNRLESSTGGIGGCPFIPGAAGNVATEDLVYMLHRMGISTGIDEAGLLRCSRMLEETLGRPLQAKAGRLAGSCKKVKS